MNQGKSYLRRLFMQFYWLFGHTASFAGKEQALKVPTRETEIIIYTGAGRLLGGNTHFQKEKHTIFGDITRFLKIRGKADAPFSRCEWVYHAEYGTTQLQNRWFVGFDALKLIWSTILICWQELNFRNRIRKIYETEITFHTFTMPIIQNIISNLVSKRRCHLYIKWNTIVKGENQQYTELVN